MPLEKTPPPNVEEVKFSLLNMAETINKFLYAIVVAMGPEYETYKTLIVAAGWTIVVGTVGMISLFIFIKGAGLFEETSHLVDNKKDDNELDIPDYEFSKLEEVTEHPPPEDQPSKTLDEISQSINDIQEKKHDENIIVVLSSYNVRKSQIEKKLMELREVSKKRITYYIKEEIDLFRDKVTEILKQNIVSKNNMSMIDVENSNDFIIFKLISSTARPKLIEHLISSYEKGDFDLHGDDQFEQKLQRRSQLYKHTYVSVFQPMPIRVSMYSSQDISDAVDSMNLIVISSMNSLIDFIFDEELELKKQTLVLEEELNSSFSHIIQIIDNIQSKFGEIKA